jgi:tripartite-type tricarboxylate transporter receptor subunit TctC
VVNQTISDGFAENAAQITGMSFIIENRPGTGGAVGFDAVQRATADGYTLLLTNESLAVLPCPAPSSYNFERGLSPVSMLTSSPLVLVVNASVQANNLIDLVNLAKSNPGQLKYASSGNGSLAQFAGEEFRTASGTNIVHVPYRDSLLALQDLLAGNVSLMFGK